MSYLSFRAVQKRNRGNKSTADIFLMFYSLKKSIIIFFGKVVLVVNLQNAVLAFLCLCDFNAMMYRDSKQSYLMHFSVPLPAHVYWHGLLSTTSEQDLVFLVLMVWSSQLAILVWGSRVLRAFRYARGHCAATDY